MKYTQEQLDERFEKLPERVRTILTSPTIAKQINGLRERHELHIDSAGTLMEEVAFVLLGLTTPNNFVHELKKELDLPTETIEKIATEINDIVFKPIHDELVGKNLEKEGDERNALLKEIEGEDVSTPKDAPMLPKQFLAEKTPLPKNDSVAENEKMPPTIPNNLPSLEHLDIAKEKLSENVALKREKEIVPPSAATPKELSAAANEEPLEKKSYGGQDPYREPISNSNL
jgi:hypothetical protein